MNPTQYRDWKQAPAKPKEVNPASFAEFPDLGKPVAKPTVFQGTSLAARLKDAIAAEEEAAVLKRLKKGETPEQILRESCTVLPCKGLTSKSSSVPDWVTDAQPIETIPSFRHKSQDQVAQERAWKRLGIAVRPEPVEEDLDTVSLPSDDGSQEEEEQEENLELY